MLAAFYEAQYMQTDISGWQPCTTDQALDVRQSHTTLLRPEDEPYGISAKSQLPSSSQATVGNDMKTPPGQGHGHFIKCLSSSCNGIIKTAQPNFRLKENCDRRNPTFMIDEPTKNFLNTFGDMFVCQAQSFPILQCKEESQQTVQTSSRATILDMIRLPSSVPLRPDLCAVD